MTMCEYDRGILKEVRDVLYEIRDVLKITREIHESSFKYVMRKNNKHAQINQEALQYHLDLMQEANEGE